MTCSKFFSAHVLILILLSCVVTEAQDDGVIVKNFQERIKQYQSLKNQQGVSSKQSSSASKVAQQEKHAAETIQQARPVAKQGEIFTPQASSYFRKQIQATLNGPGGDKVRASLRHAEPLPNLNLQVNAPYPKNLPLQSTPPTLLMNLPPLPKGLQYRIVGSTLILYDETSRLVVDFITAAIS